VEVRRLHLPRLGLRARVVSAFAIGALLLSALLSVLALGVTRTNIVSQRESAATLQMYVNAGVVRSTLGESNTQQVLTSLTTPFGSSPIVYTTNRDFVGKTPDRGGNALPAPLKAMVLGGEPGRMRYDLDGEKYFAVGVPIPAIDGAYFEVVSFQDLDDTLLSLGLTLLGASIATTLAGAGLGLYASRRVLRPVRQMGVAAEAIATGALDTRLVERFDPDLDPLLRSFNEMVEALSVRIDRDQRFASDVSHELRSPLMTLSASVEVLENTRDELPERAQAALDLLSADLDRFRQLVEDLLEMSRFDAGVMRLELDEVLAPEFVRAAVASAGYDTPVQVSPEVYGKVIAIDKRRIARVVQNLLENAKKYGGGATSVSVYCIDDQLYIAVEDEGAGVPEEDRTLIFERFARGITAGRRTGAEGVGLGLALVAEHIRLHGGEISVEDRADGREGARFVIRLPVVELDDADEELVVS
jgi:two-component system sensor histidine kinase MtrB